MGKVAAFLHGTMFGGTLCVSSMCSQHNASENQLRLPLKYAMVSTHPHISSIKNAMQNKDVLSDLAFVIVIRYVSCKSHVSEFCIKSCAWNA